MTLQNRIFAVFAFEDLKMLEKFKTTQDINCIAERKLAGMLVEDTYNPMDVVELFDVFYPCYLIYELTEPTEELVMGKTAQREIAS